MVKRAAFIALVLAGACTFPEQPLPPGESTIVVHAILDPSQRYQVVSLSSTDGSTVTPADLDSAIVVVTTPDGTALLARQDTASIQADFGPLQRTYRIDLQSAGVSLVPGGTYQLSITTRAGGAITGTTTIPSGAVAPPPPLTTFVMARDTVRLSWDAVAGARTYEVLVWTQHAQCTGCLPFISHSAFAEQEVVLAGTEDSLDGGAIFQQQSRAWVYLMAVDDNYYQYYRLLGDPYIGAAPSRLDGALGLFGSVVPIIRRQLDVR